MDAQDRIDELEEQIRQMREAFAPPLPIPMHWRLPPHHRQVLTALIRTPCFHYGHYRYYCEPKKPGGGRDDKRNLSVVMYRVRQFLGRHVPTVKIHTRAGVGFYITDDDKRKILRTMEAVNISHGLRGDYDAQARV